MEFDHQFSESELRCGLCVCVRAALSAPGVTQMQTRKASPLRRRILSYHLPPCKALLLLLLRRRRKTRKQTRPKGGMAPADTSESVHDEEEERE